MKILNRKDFMALKGPVLYAKGQETHEEGNYILYPMSGSFGGLSINYGAMWFDPYDKHGSYGDWVYCEPKEIDCHDPDDMDAKFEEMYRTGKSVPLDLDMTMRDGLFDPDAVFLVYEREDLLKLRDVIDKALEANANE